MNDWRGLYSFFSSISSSFSLFLGNFKEKSMMQLLQFRMNNGLSIKLLMNMYVGVCVYGVWVPRLHVQSCFFIRLLTHSSTHSCTHSFIDRSVDLGQRSHPLQPPST